MKVLGFTSQLHREVETIAAISTPLGQSGIGIVRLSGPDAILIGRKIFRSCNSVLGNRIRYVEIGAFLNERGQEIDHGLAWVFARPNSYTGEDVVEFSCHGNTFIMEAIVKAAIFHGAVMAKHGEFTRRAFLNGKLDLIQAEAVIDLIQAEGQFSVDNAYGQLKGCLSAAIGNLKDTLLRALSQVEALLDFSEEDLHVDLQQVVADIKSALAQSRELTDSFTGAAKRCAGLAVVIGGPPNAGKSSLFNTLLKESRAIVSPTPGTTRDLVEARIYIGGDLYRLIDTAGIHPTADLIECEGISRALLMLEGADLILLVLDSSVPWSDQYQDLLGRLRPSRDIVVLSKSDLDRVIRLPSDWQYCTVEVSVIDESSIRQLNKLIELRVSKSDQTEGMRLTRLRHYNTLVKVCQCLERTHYHISTALFSPECLADDLREALESLSLLQGVKVNEEVLDLIFSEFCIGK